MNFDHKWGLAAYCNPTQHVASWRQPRAQADAATNIERYARSHEWLKFDLMFRRIDYKVIRTGAIEESHPHLAPLLATRCDSVIYHKDLKR